TILRGSTAVNQSESAVAVTIVPEFPISTHLDPVQWDNDTNARATSATGSLGGLVMVERNHYLSKPPGPLFGFWSWRYLNKFKTLRLIMSKRVKSFYKNFPNLFPPSSECPAIELETADGGRINTADLLGRKHFVLFTGAIT
ncbi:MAG: hypothetical protein ACE5MM_01260, partial [Nitrospiraceae bacterium]